MKTNLFAPQILQRTALQLLCAVALVACGGIDFGAEPTQEFRVVLEGEDSIGTQVRVLGSLMSNQVHSLRTHPPQIIGYMVDVPSAGRYTFQTQGEVGPTTTLHLIGPMVDGLLPSSSIVGAGPNPRTGGVSMGYTVSIPGRYVIAFRTKGAGGALEFFWRCQTNCEVYEDVVFDAYIRDSSLRDVGLLDAGLGDARIDDSSIRDSSFGDAAAGDVALGDGATVEPARVIEEQAQFGLPMRGQTIAEGDALLVRPQYVTSFNFQTKNPNWVAWISDAVWIGNARRPDGFQADPLLDPSQQGVDSDYTFFTRGHLCPNGERNRSVEDARSTFVFTNIVPQTSVSNSGIWNHLEIQIRDWISAGRTFYQVAGPLYETAIPCTGASCVAVPSSLWKVIVEVQTIDGLRVVSDAVETIAVIMPNDETRGTWQQFRVSIDEVEARTGLDFFTGIEDQLEARIEARGSSRSMHSGQEGF